MYLKDFHKVSLSLLFVSIIAVIFLFSDIDERQGIDTEVGNLTNDAILLNIAKENSISFGKLLSNYHENWPLGQVGRELAFSVPLSTILLQISYKLFGVSLSTTFLLASILGLIAVFLIYKLGTQLYNWKVGTLSAILLSSSASFNLLLKSGFIFFGTTIVTLLVALCCFNAGHFSNKIRYSILSGIALAVAWFSGYSPIFILPVILLVFIVWDGFICESNAEQNLNRKYFKKLRFFQWKHYLLISAICLFCFLFFTISFSLYANGSPFETFFWLNHRWLLMRGTGQSLISEGVRGIRQNAVTLFKYAFIGGNPEELGFVAHVLPNQPLIMPFATFFLLVGIFSAWKESTSADKLCLSWLVVPFTIFIFLIRFAPRYFIILLPVIYIIAAKGILRSVTFVSNNLPFLNKLYNAEIRKIIISSLIGILLIYTLYSSYYSIFSIYPQHNSEVYRHNEIIYQVGNYIEQYPPDSIQLVFSDYFFIQYPIFLSLRKVNNINVYIGIISLTIKV